MSEKWWDMSDDELDDLFREASEKVDVPFNSSAYNKLRQKIAEQPMSESPKGFKKRWLFLLAGLFLMVGVGLVYRFGNDLKKNNSTEITRNIENKNTIKPLNEPFTDLSEKSQNKDSELIKSENLTKKETVSNLQKETTVEKSKASLSVSSQTISKENVMEKLKMPLFINSQTTSKANLKSSSAKTIVADTKIVPKENLGKSFLELQTTADKPSVRVQTMVEGTDTTTVGNLNKSSMETQKTAENTQIIAKDIQKKTIEDNNYSSNNTENQLVTKSISKKRIDKKGKNNVMNSVIVGQNILPIIENSMITQGELISEENVNKTNFYDVDFLKNKGSKLLLTNTHAELPYYVDSLPRTVRPVKFSKFGVRLVLSSDLNSIENLGKVALGGSVGLLFEYKISKRLVIQTGMVYSNKSYAGSFDSYRNWKDWKGYHPSKPTEVDGGCKVIDVPINLRLNLFQKPKQTWFVSSGVSSYWMMNENYTYNYDWYSSRAVNWSDNSKYYFSVLNFSVGLEREISKHFSIQVEPYLKTPLKNVGRGGVSLYSSGILFSTRYGF